MKLRLESTPRNACGLLAKGKAAAVVLPAAAAAVVSYCLVVKVPSEPVNRP